MAGDFFDSLRRQGLQVDTYDNNADIEEIKRQAAANTAAMAAAGSGQSMPNPFNGGGAPAPAPKPVPAKPAGLSQQKAAQLAEATDRSRAKMDGYLRAATLDSSNADLVQRRGYNWRGLDTAVGEAQGANEYMEDSTGERGVVQWVGDTINAPARDLTTGLMGVGGAALSGIGWAADKLGADGVGSSLKNAGVAVQDATSKTREWFRGAQSNDMQGYAKAQNAREQILGDAVKERARELYSANEQKYEKDKRESGELVADLKKWGRDAMVFGGKLGMDFSNTVTNLDVANTVDIVAGAAGSLGSSKIISKGLEFGGRAAVAGAERAAIEGVKRGAISAGNTAIPKAIDRAAELGDKYRFAAAIGIQEGGGAWDQTVGQIMAMDQSKLEQESPYFNELVAGGMSPDQARIEVATTAGVTAGATQGAVAAVIGRMTGADKFEDAIGRAGRMARAASGREALRDIGRETLEESLQGLSGQLIGNAAIKENADASFDMSDGVAKNFVDSFIGGMGVGGIVNAKPLAGAAGRKVVGKAKEKNQQLENELNAEAEALSTGQVDTQRQTVVEGLTPEAKADLEQKLAASAPDETAAQDRINKIRDIMGRVEIGEAEHESEANPTVRGIVEASTNRFTALTEMQKLIASEEATPEDKVAAGLWISEQLDGNDSALQSSLVSAIEAVDDSDPALPTLYALEDTVMGIKADPRVQEAVAKARALNDQSKVELADDEIGTPMGNQKIQNAVRTSTSDPAAANPALNRTIMNHVGAGRVSLTPKQAKSLETAAEIGEAAQEAVDVAKGIEIKIDAPLGYAPDASPVPGKRMPKSSEEVADNVRRTTDSATKQLSLSDHIGRVTGAVNSGDVEGAKASLQNLWNFAKSYQNKIAALNENMRIHGGQRGAEKAQVQYDNWVPSKGEGGEWQKTAKGAWVALSGGSKVFAQRAGIEAKLTAKVVNSLIKANPELGIQPIEIVDLDPRVTGSVRQTQQNAPQDTAAAPIGGTDEAVQASTTPYTVTGAKNGRSYDVEVVRKNGQVYVDQVDRETGKKVRHGVKKENQSLTDMDLLKKSYGAPNGKTVIEAKTEAPAEPEMTDDTVFSESKPVERAPEKGRKADTREGEFVEDEVFSGRSYDSRNDPKANEEVSLRSEPVETTEENAVAEQAERDTKDVGETTEAAETAQPEGGDQQVAAEVEETTSDENAEDQAVEQEAPAEEAAEPAKAPEAPKSVKDMIPAAISGSLLVKGFAIAKKAGKARLLSMVRSIEEVHAALGSSDTLAALMGKQRPMLEDTRQAYLELLGMADEVVARMKRQLALGLDTRINAKSGVTYGDSLAEGNPNAEQTPHNVVPTGKAFNFAERTEDGGIVYNEKLLQDAVLAAIQWLIDINRAGTRRMKLKQVASFLGVKEEELTDPKEIAAVIAFAENGISQDLAKNALGQRVIEFLGLDARQDVELGLTKGVIEGIGAELLRAMNNVGVLEVSPLQKFRGKDHRVVKLAQKDSEMKALLVRVGRTPEFLASIGDVDGASGISYNEPSKKVPATQQRNPFAPNSEQSKTAIERSNRIGFRLNRRMFDTLLSMTREQVVEFFGTALPEGDVDAEFNVNHKASLEGSNRVWESAYDTIVEMVETMKGMVADGASVGEVMVYFEHNYTKANRKHMHGKDNPQANKLMRELLLSTFYKMDLSTVEYDGAYGDYMLALAQRLEASKVNKVSREDSIQAAEDLLMGPLAESVEILRTALEETAEGEPLKLSDEDRLTIRDALEEHGHLVPEALHALVDFARYINAFEAGTANEFETAIYLEADGITDGAINAMQHVTTGPFTARWVAMMMKGGLSFIPDLENYSQMYNSGIPGTNKDLYQTSSDALKGIVANTLADPKVSKFDKDRLKAILHLMDSLNLAIEYDEENGKLVIGRGVLKNPLTITIYGSGKKGIGLKLASQIADGLYAQLSNVRALTPRQIEALKALVWTKENRNDANLKNIDWVKFTLTDEQHKAMGEAITKIFVGPMIEAMDEAIGEIRPGMKAIQKGVQVQSIVAAYAARKMITDKMAEKEAEAQETGNGWTKDAGLTPLEFKAIFERLEKMGLMATMSTDTQNFAFGGSDSVELGANRHFGEALPGREKNEATFRTDAKVPGLSDAGVAGVSGMIQGTGDGRAEQNFITQDNDYWQHVLPVFDGINMPAGMAREIAKAINMAVRDGWLADGPLKALDQSYDRFVENKLEAIVKVLPNEAHELLADALEIYGNESKEEKETRKKTKAPLPPEMVAMIAPELRTLGRLIKAMNQDNLDRKEAMRRVRFWVDHMASAGVAYEHEGETIDFGTVSRSDIDKGTGHPMLFKIVADRLNKELKAIQAERRGNAGQTAEPLVATNPVASKLNVGEKHETGVLVLDPQDQPKLLKKTVFSPGQKELLNASIRALWGSRKTVVLGSHEQLAAYARQVTGDVDMMDAAKLAEEKVFGAYEPKSDVIYLVDLNPETLVHELIHAATYGKVEAYYSGKGKLNAVERGLIERIERLAKEWLENTDVAAMNKAARGDYEHASAIVRGFMQNEQKALGLNEFMAYVLSNRNLARRAAKTQASPRTVQLLHRAWSTLKELILGKRTQGERLNENVSSSIYDQLRFNTLMVIDSAANSDGGTDTSLYQGYTPGQQSVTTSTLMMHMGVSNDRWSNEIGQKFAEKITVWIDRALADRNARTQEQRDLSQATNKARREQRVQVAMAKAVDLGNKLIESGYEMTPQQQHNFELIVQAFATGEAMDPQFLLGVHKVWDHVISQIDAKAFVNDPDVPGLNAEDVSADMYNALLSIGRRTRDEDGRSMLAPVFVALSVTSPQMRRLLAGIQMPSTERWGTMSADAVLNDAADLGMTTMQDWFSGLRAHPDTLTAMESLADSLAKTSAEEAARFEIWGLKHIGQGVGMANAALSKAMGWLGATGARKIHEKTDGKGGKVAAAGQVAAAALSVLDNKTAKQEIRGVMEMVDSIKSDEKTWVKPMVEIVDEMGGRTEDNAPIFDMIKPVRAMVEKVRQRYRVERPRQILRQFKKRPTDEQLSHMTQAMAGLDMGTLSLDETMDLLSDPTSVTQLIQQEEKGLSAAVKTEAKALARSLNDPSKRTHNQYRNAFAITQAMVDENASFNGKRAHQVDRLVSLYAVQGMDPAVRASLQALAVAEPKGVRHVAGQLKQRRQDEMKVFTSDRARLNHWKGEYHTTNAQNRSLIVADADQHTQLKLMSYEELGEYERHRFDQEAKGLRYYYAKQPGKAPFVQGVAQTILPTAFGVDADTGYSVGKATAGVIDNPQVVAKIKALPDGAKGTELLSAIRNRKGEIIAYERLLHPEKTARLEKETRVHEVLGIWKGHQYELQKAGAINRELVGKLAKMWTEGKAAGKADLFVDLYDPEVQKRNPAWADATKLLNRRIRREIEASFGLKDLGNGESRPQLWVRRSMIKDAVGYRQASVGDAWTGKTDWSEGAQKAFREVAIAVGGTKAYGYLTAAERGWQNFVGDAKKTIVVRSVIVPMMNLLSGNAQLMARGVAPWVQAKEYPKKLAEANQYMRLALQKQALQGDREAANGNPAVERRIGGQIRAIDDTVRRLSIWPLIEAGELSSITDVDLSNDDRLIYQGKWGEFLEQQVDKLPGALRTAGKYAYISQDTALFQGLQKLVIYGDFLAKAVLYDHLTKNNGLTSEEALVQISEEFVHYDRNPGRTRSYLDSIGMTWFWHFKLRSLKVGLSILRNNPLHFILSQFFGPGMFVDGVGTPVSDNVLAATLDGRMGYSIGPGQGFHAWQLNPGLAATYGAAGAVTGTL